VVGVRVHHGLESGGRPSENTREAWTDSEGVYTLVGLAPGRYPVAAFHAGFHLGDPIRDGRDPQRRRGPQFHGDAVAGGRGDRTQPDPRIQRFHEPLHLRPSGPTEAPADGGVSVGRTAQGGADYVSPLTDRITIPAGSVSATLGVVVQNDQLGEPPETLVLTVGYPRSFAERNEVGDVVFTTTQAGDLWPGRESRRGVGRGRIICPPRRAPGR